MKVPLPKKNKQLCKREFYKRICYLYSLSIIFTISQQDVMRHMEECLFRKRRYIKYSQFQEILAFHLTSNCVTGTYHFHITYGDDFILISHACILLSIVFLFTLLRATMPAPELYKYFTNDYNIVIPIRCMNCESYAQNYYHINGTRHHDSTARLFSGKVIVNHKIEDIFAQFCNYVTLIIFSKRELVEISVTIHNTETH